MTEFDSKTDGQLLSEFADSGDQAAFAELVGRHGAMVRGVCARVLEERDEAQDVAQAVFLALASKARSLRKDLSVGGWLHVVASRLALNARRDRACRLRHEETAMQERQTAETGPAVAGPFREELDAVISAMPEKYRQPLVLFHLEENSLEQTAGRLGLNVKTVGTRLVRAREMLRRDLVRRGVTVGSVGALTALLSAEAGAAVLPATFVSATVQAASLAAAGKLAAGVGTGVVSAKVAALTKGAANMLFWSSVKTAAVATAAAVVVAGSGAIVAQEVAAQRKAAEQPAAAPPVAEGNSADRFASPAWRGDDASYDLERVGIRVYQIGGWGPGGLSGWATPAELRRQTMPATNYVNAWAASQEREVLWLSDARVTVTSARVRVDQASGVSVLEGGIRVELPGARAPITGERAEFHKGRNTLMVDGVDIPLPGKNVAIIGTKAELDAMKQRAGGETATVEKFLAMLMPQEGPPAAEQGYQRGDYVAEEEQATLRKIFAAAEGKAKVDAAKKLCAAGGDDGLAFLKSELSKQGASTNLWASDAVTLLGKRGGSEEITILRDFLLDRSSPNRLRNTVAFALCQNGSAAAVEATRTALKSDDTNTAYWATFGLEFLGGKSGLELAALALAHTDSRVRRAGAFGAYRAHGERALPLIEKALTDKDAHVRKMAANGLANIGGDKAAALIQRQLAIEKDAAVVKALKDAEAQLKK